MIRRQFQIYKDGKRTGKPLKTWKHAYTVYNMVIDRNPWSDYEMWEVNTDDEQIGIRLLFTPYER